MSVTLSTDTNSGSRDGRMVSNTGNRFHRDTRGNAILCTLLAMAATAFGSAALRLNQTNGELREQVRSLEILAGVADEWTHGRGRRP